MSEAKRLYNTKEISRILSIGESTTRKWCVELEMNGYNFIKGQKNTRSFDNHDLEALIYFKELIKTKMKTKEEAGTVVAKSFIRNKTTGRTLRIAEGSDDSLEGQILLNIEEIANEVKLLKEEQKIIHEKLDFVIKSLSKDQVVEIKLKGIEKED